MGWRRRHRSSWPRAAQGLGAALLAPAGLALVTALFAEGPERNRALGLIATVSGIGFGAGAIVGGLLTGYLSWRGVFFVNVPIGALALLAALPLLPARGVSGSEGRRAWDVGGIVLGTAGLALLLLALTQLATPAGGVGRALALGGLALLLGVAFVVIERRSRDPLVPLDIFRRRGLTIANLVALLLLAAGAILAFILTLYVQRVMGLSPIATGLAFLPSGVGGVVGGQIAPHAVKRLGLRWSVTLGSLLLALGCLVLLGITAQGALAVVVIGYLIGGIGLVWTSVAATIAATAGLERERQGLAAGLLNTAQQLGAGIGVSLASVVATLVTQASAARGHVAATAGDRAALALALGLAVAAGLLAAAALRHDRGRPPPPRARAQPQEAARGGGHVITPVAAPSRRVDLTWRWVVEMRQ